MFVTISDVHIKERGDEPYNLMLNFLRSDNVKNCTDIFFLGDVFDLMAGTHLQYFDHFPEYFDEIERLLRAGKKIHYLEGNHDMHLEQLYHIFLERRELLSFKFSGFNYYKKAIEKKFFGKSFLFCHGDDIELGNIGYKRYRKFVGTKFVQFLAEDIVPYWFIRDIGGQNAESSRKRNKEKYSHHEAREDIRDLFREAARIAKSDREYDFIISGHSHEKDLYHDESGFTFVNNGFVPVTKNYILVDDKGARFQEII